MGVEYDLISDATREGYELGKGPWGEPEFERALRSDAPVDRVRELLIRDNCDPAYAFEVACAVVAFAAAHPDWRVINDCSSDISVMTDEEREEMLAEECSEGFFPDDDNFPIYRKVGSRYRKAIRP